MMTDERRRQLGVAIVTARPGLIKQCYRAAGFGARVLMVQAGPSWPEHRAPVVLDTIGLPLGELVALLANPPALLPATHQPIGGRRAPATDVPLIAFAAAQDWRALRLLTLCPAVRLICPDDPAVLWRWLPHLGGAVAARADAPLIWLVAPPPALQLDPLLLPILAALPSAPSLRMVAARCAISESTLARVLRGTRTALGLPPGEVARFRPDELAALLLERLGIARRCASDAERREVW
jgi:hypothetical protein